MLNHLELTNVGPAASMRLDFGPRLNLLTGNNSLGKTFVLDVAWWALTQTWPGKDERQSMAWPLNGKRREASIEFSTTSGWGTQVSTSGFDAEREIWSAVENGQTLQGLVLYLRTDGSFSLWDSVRNRNLDAPERLDSFNFDMLDIWNGLRNGRQVYCEGLLSDWKTWSDRKQLHNDLLRQVLERLSPHESDWLKPGPMARVSLNDVREIPTIVTPYGEVPVTLASAGVKRILALAYLIVWAYTEHVLACILVGGDPASRFTVLIDEVELHLHPQWQRVLLPALLGLLEDLPRLEGNRRGKPTVQIIVSTHAPLVMASVEPGFNEDSDRVFHFGLGSNGVVVEPVRWSPQGDAVNWLVSEVFGLEQARSKEAEVAIEAAEAFMRGDALQATASPLTRESIHQKLVRTLPAHDHFWPRWLIHANGDAHDQV